MNNNTLQKNWLLIILILFSITCTVDTFYDDESEGENNYVTVNLTGMSSSVKVVKVVLENENGEINSFYQEIQNMKVSFYAGEKGAYSVSIIGYDLNESSYEGSLNFKISESFSNIEVKLNEQLPDPPIAPILAGEVIDTSLLKVSWKRVFDIAGYRLERSSDGLEFNKLSDQLDTFYVDTLSPNTKRWYRVAAYNRGGDSPYSDVVTLTTAAVPPPETPENFDTTSVTYQMVKLEWDVSAGTSMYYIYRGVDGGATGDTPFDSATSDSWTDDNITPEKIYSYALTAANSSGESQKTSALNVVIPKAPVSIPDVPAGVSAEGVSESVITVTWNSVSNTEGYIIYSSSSESGTYSMLDTVKSSTEYSDGGLNPETTVYYKVTAYNEAGETEKSASAYATTDAAALTPPNTPTGVAADALSASSIQVNWTAVTGASGYIIYRNSSALDTVAGTSFTEDGLTSNTSYSYQVSAYNSAGESAKSTAVSATTMIELTVPTSLVATALSSSSVSISWNSVSGAEGYELFRSLAENSGYVRIVQQSGTAYQDDGLAESTTYYYKVLAYLGSTTSDTSGAVSTTTEAGATAPNTPTGLAASGASTSSVSVSWSSVADAESYKLYYSTSEGGFYSEVYSGTTTSYTHTGLNAGTTYYYKVTAINAAGESAKSTATSGTTEEATIVKMKIIYDLCKPCGSCKAQAACPQGAVYPSNGKYAIDPTKCDGCGGSPQCVPVCPVSGAIVEDN